LDSRRIRDDLAKQVQVGEVACLRCADEIHAAGEAEHEQRVAAEQHKLELARVSQLAAESALARLAEEKFEQERQHSDARANIRSREKRDWDHEDRVLIRKWHEGIRHGAAGVDPLPARLQQRAEEELRQLQENADAGVVGRALAVSTLDGDGNVIPAYSQLSEDGAVPLVRRPPGWGRIAP
jgi:hypothetical protein